MRVPLSWLKDYVDLPEPVDEIARRLTFAGIEVEGIETVGGTFEGVIVGEVRSVEKHANADKLSVCRVFDGQQEWPVVCGAPNVTAGGKYPFAQIGAHLPAVKLTIEKRKVRGVESCGMLCAPDELGLEDSHAGLLTLDAKWTAGTALATVFGPPETIFELEITPNRPDCLSVIGVARELAAMFGRPLRLPETPAADGRQLQVPVSVENAEDCPRYTARLLKNIKLGPAPDWMQRRLELSGVRAINNIVDITNYVMLECGQPLHAFDFALLAGGRIEVRRARPGDRMATLDGLERALTPETLLIADAQHPVAMAGVMGGAGSEIRDVTHEVLLESASFKPLSVRSTSRRLGLSTESSYRFERGVDAEGCDWASRRAADLMKQFAGAELQPGSVDARAPLQPSRSIFCRFDRVNGLIGVEATPAEIVGTFKALGLTVEQETPVSCAVRPPSFRQDLEREVDLAEEFIRIYGLDRIPTRPPVARIDPDADDRPSRELSRLHDQAVALGLREIYNYSLVSESLLNLFGATGSDRIVLPNPISADESILRPMLIPQMTATLGRNRARQISNAGLFEIGRVFTAGGAERTRLCVGLMGSVGQSGLDAARAPTPEEAYLWIKGIWESLAVGQRVKGWELRDATHPAMDCACEIIVNKVAVGWIGLIKASIRREWRLSDPVAALEVETSALLARRETPRYAPVPAYPFIERDVAMVIGDNVRHEEVVRVIRAAAPKELESIRLFDVFRGRAIGAGRRSVAYALTYRSPARTLTDEEANDFHNRVKNALRKELGAELRES